MFSAGSREVNRMRRIRFPELRYAMLGINISACLFIAAVVSVTSQMACRYGIANEFIKTLGHVPSNPAASLNGTLFWCIVLFADFVIRLSVSHRNLTVVYITLYLDTVANIMLLIVLDCNYNGFILWELTNIVYYMKDNRKYLVIIAGTFVYMVFSHDLISVYLPLFSVREYFLFYVRGVQQKLFLLYYVLHDLNFVCFIIFCMGVIRRQKSAIDEIRSLYAQLRKANATLKEYADIKERMGETRERNRLAREIHDIIGHSLTGISVGVDTCVAIMDANPSAAKSQLQVISGIAKDGIADIRRSVRMLQSEDDDLPLEQKLAAMLENTRRATGITIQYECNIPLNFSTEEEAVIFRVVQESVTNAIRHGHAQRIDVTIQMQESELLIQIVDDGRGCKKFESGFGTTHIRERLSMLGGTVDFSSQGGFSVKAVLPIRNERGNI